MKKEPTAAIAPVINVHNYESKAITLLEGHLRNTDIIRTPSAWSIFQASNIPYELSKLLERRVTGAMLSQEGYRDFIRVLSE